MRIVDKVTKGIKKHWGASAAVVTGGVFAAGVWYANNVPNANPIVPIITTSFSIASYIQLARGYRNRMMAKEEKEYDAIVNANVAAEKKEKRKLEGGEPTHKTKSDSPKFL